MMPKQQQQQQQQQQQKHGNQYVEVYTAGLLTEIRLL